jgi:hypothetical protein
MATLGIKTREQIAARLRVIARIATESTRVRAEEDRRAFLRSGPGHITIRRLLVLVALGALSLAAFRHPWSVFCDARAEYHTRMSSQYSKPWPGRTSRSWVIMYDQVFQSSTELAAYQSQMRDYHARMRDKWERAATLPWLALIPETPPSP